MTPDDPRHGTVAGHVAHQREGSDYCQPCITAKAMYDKRRVWDAANGRTYTVPSIGARRRIQALLAVGWSRPQVAREAGWESSGALRYVMRSDTMTRATHDRIAETYERLCMKTPPNEMVARRVKTWARKGGYAPPLAWDNIDDPNERPDLGSLDHDIDRVVVSRILAHDASLARTATVAERRAVVAAWPGSLAELERMTGWKADRYIDRKDGAA